MINDTVDHDDNNVENVEFHPVEQPIIHSFQETREAAPFNLKKHLAEGSSSVVLSLLITQGVRLASLPKGAAMTLPEKLGRDEALQVGIAVCLAGLIYASGVVPKLSASFSTLFAKHKEEEDEVPLKKGNKLG